MMTIPHWVDAKQRGKIAKSRARLRYMVAQLAANYTTRNSVRALGEAVGVDHSTISIYINRGYFSESSARKIMKALKPAAMQASFLMEPLSVPRSPV